MNAVGAGTGSSLYVFNMDASMYSSMAVDSLESISLRHSDFGSASMTIAPGGSQSTAAGPTGFNALMENLTAGDVTMSRMAPRMHNVTIGSLTLQGNSPVGEG